MEKDMQKHGYKLIYLNGVFAYLKEKQRLINRISLINKAFYYAFRQPGVKEAITLRGLKTRKTK